MWWNAFLALRSESSNVRGWPPSPGSVPRRTRRHGRARARFTSTVAAVNIRPDAPTATTPSQVPTTSLPGAYWRQWSASVISNLGDGINFVAMPLLALSLTADTRLLALTTLVTFVPWLVLALPF